MSSSLFNAHINHVCTIYAEVLKNSECQDGTIDSVLVHSGSEQYYYGDDRDIRFQAFGHFCHWIPVNRPDQFLYFKPGNKPIYFQVVPNDYWYDLSIDAESWWADEFDIVKLNALKELPAKLPNSNIAYLGGHPQVAKFLGIKKKAMNPSSLLRFLDFQRAYKTDYELEQLRAANQLAAVGHKAARNCFLDGGNEYQIHMAFLTACDILEEESPYTNIVALDEKSAILHYQQKRRESADQSQVLLIDAGCRINGYASDITRTWAKDTAPLVFKDLLKGMQGLEQQLVNLVTPGLAYPEIHSEALAGVANLLIALDICHGTSEELIRNNLPQRFLPHGIGHLLGIQVHDVGGHQTDAAGNKSEPPQHSPALRNTRVLDENMVFTIEPGCYFIPLLLEPLRSQSKGVFINWALVDELYHCGGIRIEDNVRVTKNGFENLTQQFE